MIYDGHAYIFPNMRGDGGFDDRREFQRHLQLAIATHFMPVWRTRDRAEADNSGLLDLSMPRGFDALKDAHFRATQFGRFEWTVGGEDYFKQYMPPSVVDMEFTADDLIAEMDYAEVDRALLHRTPYLGIGNDLVADAVQAYPDRIQALAHVPEWKIASDPDWAIAELDHAINDLGLHGLQLLPDHMALYGQSTAWDGEALTPLWDHFTKLGVPLFVTPGYTSLARTGSGGGMDLSEFETVSRFMERYPDVQVVLTHGLSWRSFADENGIDVPDAVYDALPDRQSQLPRPTPLRHLLRRDVRLPHAADQAGAGEGGRAAGCRPADVGDGHPDGDALPDVPSEPRLAPPQPRFPRPGGYRPDLRRKHGAAHGRRIASRTRFSTRTGRKP